MESQSPLRGRDAELEVLGRLTTGHGGGEAVLVTGAPGMGKSRLWTQGVALGRRAGMRVLATVCSPSETEMPYAGLADLIEPLVDEFGPGLPDPQRQALDQMLLRSDEPPRSGAVGRRIVAASVSGVLRRAVAAGPVLLAVDDQQWLDVETDQALTYAARRLCDHDPLRVLLAAREPLGPSADEADLLPGGPATGEASVPLLDALARRDRLRLGPLMPAAAREVLRDRRGLTLPLEEVRYLVERTGGNPFWLLEFTREGHDPVARRTPATLPTLIRRRLGGLPPDVVLVATLVAALGRPRPATVHEARPGHSAAETERALDDAIAADLLVVVDDRLAPAHPLTGAALLAAMPPFRRRRLHERAAQLADSPESRAHHLLQAHAIPGPDDDAEDGAPAADATLLAALDEAVVSLERRGAPVLATRFADRAIASAEQAGWTGTRDHATRVVAAGELHLSVGAYPRARELVDRLDLPTLPDDLFARAALVLCDAVLRVEGPGAAATALAAVDDGAAPDSGLRYAAVTVLRANPFLSGPDWARWAERAATETEADTTPPRLRRLALSRVVMARLFSGRKRRDGDPTDRALSEIEVEELDAAAGPVPAPDSTRFLRALALFIDDRLEDSRTAFDALRQQFSDAGDDLGAAIAGYQSACATFATGDVDAAQEQLDRVVARADLHLPELSGLRSLRGLIHLARGEPRDVEKLLVDEETNQIESEHLRGMLALHRQDHPTAVEALEAYVASCEAIGMSDPHMRHMIDPYLADACLETDRIARAEEIAEHLAAIAARTGRQTTRGQERRLRARIAVRRGVGDAVALAAEAVALHEPGPRPAELARSLQVLAEAHGRAGDAAAAEQAAARAEQAYRRAGYRHGPTAPEDGEPGDRLSPAEHDVARLVAAGGTDRQAAHALHLSVRTVQNHLSRIYRKLGINSRAQLRARLGSTDVGGADPPAAAPSPRLRP